MFDFIKNDSNKGTTYILKHFVCLETINSYLVWDNFSMDLTNQAEASVFYSEKET